MHENEMLVGLIMAKAEIKVFDYSITTRGVLFYIFEKFAYNMYRPKWTIFKYKVRNKIYQDKYNILRRIHFIVYRILTFMYYLTIAHYARNML